MITDDGHHAGVLAEKLNKQGLNVAVVRLPEGQPQSPLSSEVASFQAKSVDEAGIKAVIGQIDKQLGNIAGFVHLQPQSTASAEQAVNLDDESMQHVTQAFL